MKRRFCSQRFPAGDALGGAAAQLSRDGVYAPAGVVFWTTSTGLAILRTSVSGVEQVLMQNVPAAESAENRMNN